jgi:hypothetical protein
MAKRMKLIPESLYNRLVKMQLTEEEDKPGPIKDDKASLLEKNIPDDLKILLYQELARNLHQRQSNDKETPILVKNVETTPVSEPTVSDSAIPTIPTIPPIPTTPAQTFYENHGGKQTRKVLDFLYAHNMKPTHDMKLRIDAWTHHNVDYEKVVKCLTTARASYPEGIKVIADSMKNNNVQIPAGLFRKTIMDKLDPNSPPQTRGGKKLSWTTY